MFGKVVRAAAVTLPFVISAGAAAEPLEFTVFSGVSQPVVALHISHFRVKGWQGNSLTDPLLPGASIGMLIDDSTADCHYDIKAVFADGQEIADYRVDLCTRQYTIHE